ncbi:MAG: phytanoyl-CoA dioxygenase family protein [Silvibacterium sp.]|nr:phytanoyl-CoA dioxygenase family protein [Silvibacterium sp.]
MSFGLTDRQRDQFLRDGFVKIEAAFPAEVAAEARVILWQESGCDREDPRTWTRPVVRLVDCSQEPFQKAANTQVLHAAFDDLVGEGRWVPRESVGGIVIRFPHPDDPGDTGWHVDASFPPDRPTDTYLDWRVNLRSKGRALLMLFLFSDVTEHDAPTRIRLGSHLRVPRLLAPAGEEGLSMIELSKLADRETRGIPEALATGPAGTVYLCHPFLVHAGQAHRGTTPRFLGQPPLYPKAPLELECEDGDNSLVERAIRLGLEDHGCNDSSGKSLR